MRHFVLLGGWLYVRNFRVYQEFLKTGCRVVFVGCQTGHHLGCPGANK